MSQEIFPGGNVKKRPLQFIWILDCSGSMDQNHKIQSLNAAIREAIPEMKDIAKNNTDADFLIRAITFSNGAQWHISQPVSVEDFKWTDLNAGGITDMGKAFEMVALALDEKQNPTRMFPPVLVLISDGFPTDDYSSSISFFACR